MFYFECVVNYYGTLNYDYGWNLLAVPRPGSAVQYVDEHFWPCLVTSEHYD